MLREPGGYVLGRFAGVALVALGISCWLARNESQSRAALGLIGGLLFYDVGVTLILLAEYFGHGAIGLALWPAVAVHSALAIWSLLCLRNLRQRASLG
jgi:hypothetical protein